MDCFFSEDKLYKEIKRVFDMECFVFNIFNVMIDLGIEFLEFVLLRIVVFFVSVLLICFLIIGVFIVNIFVCLVVYK